LTRLGLELRKIHRMATITKYARTNPISGDSIIGITTLSRITDQCTEADAATAAPTRPPISACDDDEGSPRRHVMRFHTIAPISPDSTTVIPCELWSGAMMPLPIVLATPSEINAPMRFITAASRSATRGVSARVDTEVAMALAASWKPLV
jgi:hypothetical protein